MRFTYRNAKDDGVYIYETYRKRKRVRRIHAAIIAIAYLAVVSAAVYGILDRFF